ncbi:oncoprotein-induced transcript 3 protein-like isoform X2 [Alosa pseudoharengus]
MKMSMMMTPLSLYLPLLAMILHTPQATTAQEIDPCYNYTVLNDTWRATTNLDQSDLKCDRSFNGVTVQWQGWYLLVHQEVSVRIPNTCVPRNRCGTHAPLWLNGPHPRPEDGIVTRQVCGSWINGCCTFNSTPIQVKACPGNYTVYKLVDPLSCYFAYCTDLSDKGALPTKSPDPSHVVGLLLKVSAVETLNETEIEEQILKPFGETLRAQGLDVTGIQLRRVHQTGP